MAIRVLANESGIDVYAAGTKWVIDDYRQLHVVGENGNLGSYAGGMWASVHHLEPEELPAAA